MLNENLIYIDKARITPRIKNALTRSGILTTKDLLYVEKDKLRRIRNFGPKSIQELEEFCKNIGIDIGSCAEATPHFSYGQKVVTTVETSAMYCPKVIIPEGTILTVARFYVGNVPLYNYALKGIICNYPSPWGNEPKEGITYGPITYKYIAEGYPVFCSPGMITPAPEVTDIVD